jgi:hypothetical protein
VNALCKCGNTTTSLDLVLIDFHSQPKSQPKSAAVTKATTNAAGGNSSSGRGGRRARGGRARNARPAKKTAEELDSEMADYFDNGGAAVTEAGAGANGAGQPTANGDVMEDEVLVSCEVHQPKIMTLTTNVSELLTHLAVSTMLRFMMALPLSLWAEARWLSHCRCTIALS